MYLKMVSQQRVQIKRRKGTLHSVWKTHWKDIDEIGKTVTEFGRKEKLLRIILDDELNFKAHITTFCKKASKKLHALSRISIFMNSDKLRKL